MESTSIRSYEKVMKRRLLNNLTLLFLLLFSGSSLFAAHPAFLILKDGLDITDASAQIESMGGRIRQQVPPQIVVADLPDGINTSDLTSVKNVYFTSVQISMLEPLGSLATAAGMQWNRKVLNQARSAGASSFSAMKSMVASQSMPAPTGIVLTPAADTLGCYWNAVGNAFYYDVVLAKDDQFLNIVAHNRTPRTDTVFALPEGTGSSPLYFRVRAVDRPEGEKNTTDVVFGAWGQASLPSVTLTLADTSRAVPVLTSPLNASESKGFTVILEWNTSDDTRIQVSKFGDFSDTVVDAIVDGGSFICPSPAMQVGDRLFWRVRSWANRKSGWSVSHTVTVGEPHNEHADVFINPEAPK